MLSRKTVEQVESGRIMGIRTNRRCLEIHHLFFADDSLFFLRGSVSNARNVKQVLDDFCRDSGQRVNFAKSSIFFKASAREVVKKDIADIFGVASVVNPGFYLGLPTIWGRSRREAMAYIKERVRDKLNSWRNRLLNSAGKEVLIKFVVSAMRLM